MDPIVKIARKHNLHIIEDACQAVGARVAGRPAGTWGDLAVLSFGGSKLLAAGRGDGTRVAVHAYSTELSSETATRVLELAHHRRWEPFDRSIDIRVARLRRKIEADPKKPALIKTVWGGGYTLAAEVEAL